MTKKSRENPSNFQLPISLTAIPRDLWRSIRKPLPGTRASVKAVIRHEDSIFMCDSGNSPKRFPRLTFPGGAPEEEDVSLEAVLRRELREECGKGTLQHLDFSESVLLHSCVIASTRSDYSWTHMFLVSVQATHAFIPKCNKEIRNPRWVGCPTSFHHGLSSSHTPPDRRAAFLAAIIKLGMWSLDTVSAA